MDVSLRDLEAAFTALPVEVRTTVDVFTRSGSPVHSFRYTVTNAEATARRFFDHLRVYRDQADPWAEGEEAQCRAEGARCDREGGPCTCPCDPAAEAAACVVSATIPDPEVAAIAAIVAVMDALDEETVLLGTDVHERVIRWAMARYLGPVTP